MTSAVFESAISAFKKPQTYALDRTIIGIGSRRACFPILSRARKKNKNLIVTPQDFFGPPVWSYVKKKAKYIPQLLFYNYTRQYRHTLLAKTYLLVAFIVLCICYIF